MELFEYLNELVVVFRLWLAHSIMSLSVILIRWIMPAQHWEEIEEFDELD